MSDQPSNAAKQASTLEFTGERYTPECVREMYYEHTARYAMAATICRQFAERVGRKPRVLDAACGEGYGSDLLSPLAEQIVGIDISSEAIQHAKRRYSASNLQFEQADLAKLSLRAEFDVITSFETLEHLQEQDAMLAEFSRVLAPGGLLILSSPDRYSYSDLTGYKNPFHVKELYRHELEALLQRHLPHFRLFGQRLLFQSAIWDLQATHWQARAETAIVEADSTDALSKAPHREALQMGLGYAPIYFIALAAHQPDDLVPYCAQLHLFGDAHESVYTHYNEEIRKGIRAAETIHALQQQIRALQASQS